jgi:hypothetical protein
MPRTPSSKTPFEAYIDKLEAAPGRVGILTEGDSWFALPFPGRPNVVDVLIRQLGNKAAWLRLENNGDEARIMIAGKQWEELQKELTRPKARFDVILFSAGGNDIVGRAMLPLLKQREPWMDWRDCIHGERLQQRLAQVEGSYRELIALRDDHHPDAWIFSHDYDRAIPGDKPIRLGPIKVGPWMKPYLEMKGITDPSDQKLIVGHLLERFAQTLQRLEETTQRFHHVRTQGTLDTNEWGDEIHPNKVGFEKIAARVRAALGERFPTLL